MLNRVTLKSPAGVKRSGTPVRCTDILAEPFQWESVVVTALHEIDSVIPGNINQSMFLCDAARPDAGTEKF